MLSLMGSVLKQAESGEIDRRDGDLREGARADNGLTAIFIFNIMSSPAAHLLLCCRSPPGVCVRVYVCVSERAIAEQITDHR